MESEKFERDTMQQSGVEPNFQVSGVSRRGFLKVLSAGAIIGISTAFLKSRKSEGNGGILPFEEGWDTRWYKSPFDPTTQLENKATQETFAEPGVLLDNTASFERFDQRETFAVVPEGGYTYASVNGVRVTVYDAASSYPEKQLEIPRERGVNNLIFIRGVPSDGQRGTDLNRIVRFDNYVLGAGTASPMPAGAYISIDWTNKQIENAYGNSPNCGADGCEEVRVWALDVATGTFRVWQVNPGDYSDWTDLRQSVEPAPTPSPTAVAPVKYWLPSIQRA